MKGIYLDHNATTPPHPAVVEEMRACLEQGWGNPSSIHAHGQTAKRILDLARHRVAALVGAEPEEILFTSGGTESDNQALRGGSILRPEGAILTSAIEHSAVLDTCKNLAAQGREVRILPVASNGILDFDALKAPSNGPVALVSLMLANNDLGTLQPVRETTEWAKTQGAIMHTDAVQAVGKIAVDVRELGVDLLSISAHKLYGPKGVGALFIRRGLQLPALLHGGPQERRLRAGTENLPGIAGFGKACELAKAHLERRSAHCRHLRDLLERGVLEGISGTRCNGDPKQRVPNTSNLSFEGLIAEDLLLNLDLDGISVSLGAACQSESRKPNPVLKALGQSDAEALSSLRLSMGEGNDEDDIRRTLEILKTTVSRLRQRIQS
ncbi:MAG: cysteine desulfurase [Holophaga sp.]|nr:cysteine desulfurase [Holophaga sp.]